MAKIIFKAHDGTVTEVEGREGLSIMQHAVSNNVPGIVAECGGALSCATCHVYVDPDWQQRLDPPGGMEKDMLDFVAEPRPNSRLSCQIKFTPALDGIVLHTPESQY
jgi:2Fe-2S ferredoxin